MFGKVKNGEYIPDYDLVNTYVGEISKWIAANEERMIVEALAKANPKGLKRLRNCINKALNDMEEI